MKKKLLCLITVVVMAFAATCSLAGCNVQNTKKEESNIDADHVLNADVQFTVMTLDTTAERNVMQAWINAYQKKMNTDSAKISIEITSQGLGNMDDLSKWQNNSPDLPNIVWTAGDQHSFYSQRGYFQDLSDESKFPGSKKFFDGFYDTLIDSTHIHVEDTAINFVPRDYNRITILYNKTVFENMGIDLPEDGWTWDEFLDTCRELLSGKGGYTVACPIEWRDWAPVHTTVLTNYGGSYIDQNTCEFKLDTTGQAAWDFYNEFYNDLNVACNDKGEAFKSYQNGSKTVAAAMHCTTYADIGTILDAANKNGWTLEAVSFPNKTDASDEGKGYAGAGCSGYAITSSCTDENKRTEAWNFLKWCMSEEGYNAVANLGVICPAIKSMRNKGEWTKYGKDGTVINYHAFVDESTNDVDLNYSGVCRNAMWQTKIIGWVQEFWKSAGNTTFKSAVAKLKGKYAEIRSQEPESFIDYVPPAQ